MITWTNFLLAHINPTRARALKMRRRVAPVLVLVPTTTQLRQWLHDETTPRHIKGRIWSMLRVRRHRLG